MAIRVQHGSKAALKAGVSAGEAQRGEEDRARKEREQARADQDAATRKTQQAAMDWELQKMQMRSQQEFQQELSDRQWDYERFNRAKAWDIEKMELRSRMDFEQEEQERVQEIDRVDSKILALKKAQEDGQFTGREFEFESMMFNLEQRRFGIKNPSQLSQDDPMARQRTANREIRAQKAAGRATEAHEMRVAGAPTQEAIERDQNVTILGSWARDLSLPEQREELAALGLTPQSGAFTNDPDDVPALSPDELKASAVGKSAAERQTIYERGVQLGYWN